MRTGESSKRTILLATDFSTPSRLAYPYALKLASALKRRLILLHVVKAPPGFETWSPSAGGSLGPLKTKALLELGRMARLAKDKGVPTEHRLVVGIPKDSILKMAKETRADLIAMGTHGRTGWNRIRLGSVSEATLRKAPCPVLTIHAATGGDSPVNPHRVTVKRILVAIDFSTCSDAALRYAVRLADRFSAEAVLVHASKPSRSSGRRQVRGEANHRADQRLQNAVSASQADQVVRDRIVVPGPPVEVILDRAKRMKADLIVMGTNGRRGVQRLVLGSVAESVVRRAGCPVVVVKAGVKERPETSQDVRHVPGSR